MILITGYFDILNLSHIKAFRKAKTYKADFLVIGVESDESLSNLYGEEYPLNNQKHRLDLLSEINIVDMCFGFEDILNENTSDEHFIQRYMYISPHEIAIPKWDANFKRKIAQIRQINLKPKILDIRLYKHF